MKNLLLSLLIITLPTWANSKLDKLLDEIWQYELSVKPTYASSMGVNDNNDKLADISAAGLKQQSQRYQAYLDQLAAFDVNKLSQQERINLRMQQYRLQNYVDQYRYNAHYVPLTSEYGFHSALASLPGLVHFQSEKDYLDYLSRLQQIPAYIQQNIDWMKQGMKVGMTQPKTVMEGFEQSVEAFLVKKPQDSGFYAPFKALDKSKLSKKQQIKLREKAKAVIEHKVVPAYQQFYDFLVKEYIPAAKTDIAAKSWPNGEAYYQNRSRHYTTTDLNAVEIHKMGLAEVKRIRNEMQAIVDELKFDGNINQFIQFLRTDPQFYAQTSRQLIDRAAALSKRIDALLPKLFYKLPRTPYGVQAVPKSIAPKYTTGRYVSPRKDDQPGYYWVNTYALNKRPLYALPALTLHEAVPGHHLQISLAREMGNLPPVRRYTYISAFGEGWGLYSEYLGKEIGYYEDKYEEFGALSYEMWRACRLVVDTGMHLMGWTRQQAIEYMLENTALSEHNVKTEIDRYISWPAQALSYKIGELTIKRLREKTEKALGEKFDLRAFHDALLAHGSVPLSVLEDIVDQFILEQQKT